MLEQKASGKTIFLTTHNMQEAGLLCDNILLLDNGKIVEQGKPEELCRKYNAENQIAVVLKDGFCAVLPNGRESAEKLSAWMCAGEIVSIHSTEPDLEKVFLELTGKELNV